MKKAITLILSLALIISVATSALAGDPLPSSSAINKTLTSTSVYVNACVSNCAKDGNHYSWNAPFNGASSSQRVVVRVYELGGDVRSATWVYSDISYTKHPYKTTYQHSPMTVFLGAKVDDRDIPPITISGTFNANVN